MTKKQVGFVIIVVAVTLLIAYLAFWMTWNNANATLLAYWIQAIGSISAILGSFALAKNQAKTAEKIRNIERLEANFTIAKAALRLAIDTVVCLESTKGRIKDRVVRPRHIGPERLDQLQSSLHSFSNKNLDAEILSELLILQREVAYTQMAIREIGCSRPGKQRIANAEKRLARVTRCREAMRAIAQNCRTEWRTAKT